MMIHILFLLIFMESQYIFTLNEKVLTFVERLIETNMS